MPSLTIPDSTRLETGGISASIANAIDPVVAQPAGAIEQAARNNILALREGFAAGENLMRLPLRNAAAKDKLDEFNAAGKLRPITQQTEEARLKLLNDEMAELPLKRQRAEEAYQYGLKQQAASQKFNELFSEIGSHSDTPGDLSPDVSPDEFERRTTPLSLQSALKAAKDAGFAVPANQLNVLQDSIDKKVSSQFGLGAVGAEMRTKSGDLMRFDGKTWHTVTNDPDSEKKALAAEAALADYFNKSANKRALAPASDQDTTKQKELREFNDDPTDANVLKHIEDQHANLNSKQFKDFNDKRGAEASKLLTQFEAAPSVKAARALNLEASKIVNLAAGDSGVNDLALVNTFQRVLDPGGIVREGDISLLQNTGGIGTNIQNWISSVTSGKRLTPAQRTEMSRVAKELNERSVVSFNAHAADAANDAKMSGIGSDRFVVRPLATLTPVVAPAPAPANAEEKAKGLAAVVDAMKSVAPAPAAAPQSAYDVAVAKLRAQADAAIAGKVDRDAVEAVYAAEILKLQK